MTIERRRDRLKKYDRALGRLGAGYNKLLRYVGREDIGEDILTLVGLIEACNALIESCVVSYFDENMATNDPQFTLWCGLDIIVVWRDNGIESVLLSRNLAFLDRRVDCTNVERYLVCNCHLNVVAIKGLFYKEDCDGVS